MKLEPIVKIDKRNKVTSEIFNDDVMSESLDTIVIFPFFTNLEQLEAGFRIHSL